MALSKELRDFIVKNFGIQYTCSGLVALLHRLGFLTKRPSLLPVRKILEDQHVFVRDFEALMSALSEEEAVYFLDAVHPQHNTRSACAWIEWEKKKNPL